MLEKNSCHHFQISFCKILTYHVLGNLPIWPELLDKWNQKVCHLLLLLPTCNSKLIFKVKNGGRKYFSLIPKLFRRAHFIGKNITMLQYNSSTLFVEWDSSLVYHCKAKVTPQD